jgi:hypothetical protein
MAWEKRDKAKYYYRMRRVGPKVKRDYFGCGPIAEMSAELDAQRRSERDAQRSAWADFLARSNLADATVDDLSRHCQLLASAVLLVHGVHYHRGEWRRRRVFFNRKAVRQTS